MYQVQITAGSMDGNQGRNKFISSPKILQIWDPGLSTQSLPNPDLGEYLAIWLWVSTLLIIP